MSGMHLLPVYYTTTSSRKRKKQKKSKSLLVAEQEHAKYLKRMGVGKSNGGRSSVGRASGLQPEGRGFDSLCLHHSKLKEENAYRKSYLGPPLDRQDIQF